MHTEETKLISATIENGERIHLLKTWPEFFDAVYEGIKPFELRIADRDYKVGDTLFLEEYNPNLKEYTGRFCRREVSCILPGGVFGLETGFVIMGLYNTALGGRSIQSEGPSDSECVGDRPVGERPTNESRTLSDLVNGPQK